MAKCLENLNLKCVKALDWLNLDLNDNVMRFCSFNFGKFGKKLGLKHGRKENLHILNGPHMAICLENFKLKSLKALDWLRLDLNDTVMRFWSFHFGKFAKKLGLKHDKKENLRL